MNEQQNLVLERVGGLIERVTFHSEESGFCVLKVKVRQERDLVTVVGTLPRVTAGEWVEARGQWIIDSKFGRQLKAKFLNTTRPDTPDGMEKYLASGLVKGIGPKFAERLVKAFGVEVFDVIEKEPHRLTEVPGIGKKRFERIVKAWHEQKVVREIMVFLYEQGVGTSRAFRIYKVYGDEAINKVREDPYRLVRDIWGIGFKTADQIAEKLGISKDSELRARAGVEYTLQKLTELGHCAYHRPELVDKAQEILEIPQDIISSAIDFELARGRLAEHEDEDGRPLVYLAAIDGAERHLAQNLLELLKGKHPCPQIDVEKALQWAQSQMTIELAPAQKSAVETALTSKVMVITGGPGVGKTTIVNTIVQIFAAKGLRISLCAPTGRAAKRMTETSGKEAKTIHRLLEFDPRNGGFKRDKQNPLVGDLFIVDEASMLDITLAHQFVRAIPSKAALIIVGDVDQLPSVGPGAVLRDIIESTVIPVVRLTEIFRQAAQSAIIANAHRVNNGNKPQWPKGKLSNPKDTDFYFINADEPEEGAKLIVHLLKERIPKRFGHYAMTDIQVLCPMQRGDLGARNLNIQLQEALNPGNGGLTRFGWTFRSGDKVMQIVNDYDKDVFNGDIGRISSVDDEEQELVVLYDGREVTYAFGELDELTLAYATTVHKAQGSEFPCVVIPVHTQHYVLLQRNLLYTAITRGKSLVVLVGTQKALAIAVKRLEATVRVTTLRRRLQGE